MRKFGLIGYPLTHSFSQKYFADKFKRENISDCVYELFPISSIRNFPSLLQSHPDLCGLNVTIPYKEAVFPFLTGLSEEAGKIGAVNCIQINEGRITGYNTDAYGFEISLKKILAERPQQAFVLGTGGSSKAVAYVLKKLHIPCTFVSRSAKPGSITYPEIEYRMRDVNLFINTTPLGMYPKVEAAAEIPFEKLSPTDIVFDLIYNPAETLLLQKASAKGAKTKNGQEMLELQAEKSWEIWNSPNT